MTAILLIIAAAQGVVIAIGWQRLKECEKGLKGNRDRITKLEVDFVPILENHKTGTMLLRLRERANQ